MKDTQQKWYAVYTYRNTEKIVSQKAQSLGVECFLPLQKVERQWSDRKKKLDVPLFPGYVFVKTSLVHRFVLLNIKELVRFVGFSQPVAIPDAEIESIRTVVSTTNDVTTEPFGITAGTRVKVTEGQFAGAEGILVQRKGKDRLVIQLELLQQAISVECNTQGIVTA